MTSHISLRFLSVVIFLHFVSRIPQSDATGQCKSQVSIFRKALRGHMIDKFHVNRPDVCIKRCQIERRCQSINYVMEENICELNNRSKEVRPEDYVTDPGRIYMTVPFNKGKCSFDYLYQLLYWSFVFKLIIDWLERRRWRGKAVWGAGFEIWKSLVQILHPTAF